MECRKCLKISLKNELWNFMVDAHAHCTHSIVDHDLINGVVFVDLKKAFDTIDHQIILQKLKIMVLTKTVLPGFIHISLIAIELKSAG
jgi:hypothetical protein